jgi:aerobic carbon-monoxide dehydrogenase medium subunit
MNFVDAYELEEALAALEAHGLDATVLAGGTDVMVQYLRRDISVGTLLHVRRLQALHGIETNGMTRIGALTTHWQLVNDAHISRAHRALAEAAATVGGRQTQNVGTIGGNIINASPAADLLPPLLVGDAAVQLASSSGTRELRITELVLGRRRTAREPNELVTSIELKPLSPHTGETYLKVGRRHAMEVAVVGLAARLSFDEAGTVTDARVAVCSVAPSAFRASDAEQALVGSKLEDDSVAEAGELLMRSASPIDDARATAVYRRRVLAPLLRSAVLTCRERAVSSDEERQWN